MEMYCCGCMLENKYIIQASTGGPAFISQIHRYNKLPHNGRTMFFCICYYFQFIARIGGIPVPTAWRVLGLRMEERPPDMEVSCEYIE
jgi:hypothetical protein